MYHIKCKIDGIVPMMQDRYAMPLESEGGGRKKGKDAWKTELPLKAYVDKVGMYMPVDNIRMMLIGNKLRMGSAKILGSQIETKKGSVYLNFCKACVWVIGPKDPQKVYLTPKRKTFDDYDERTFINAAGSRSITRRPIAKTPWSLEFIIQVTDDGFDHSKIKEMFEVAGMRCGCGAYGPTFGRFVIKSWALVE